MAAGRGPSSSSHAASAAAAAPAVFANVPPSRALLSSKPPPNSLWRQGPPSTLYSPSRFSNSNLSFHSARAAGHVPLAAMLQEPLVCLPQAYQLYRALHAATIAVFDFIAARAACPALPPVRAPRMPPPPSLCTIKQCLTECPHHHTTVFNPVVQMVVPCIALGMNTAGTATSSAFAMPAASAPVPSVERAPATDTPLPSSPAAQRVPLSPRKGDSKHHEESSSPISQPMPKRPRLRSPTSSAVAAAVAVTDMEHKNPSPVAGASDGNTGRGTVTPLSSSQRVVKRILQRREEKKVAGTPSPGSVSSPPTLLITAPSLAQSSASSSLSSTPALSASSPSCVSSSAVGGSGDSDAGDVKRTERKQSDDRGNGDADAMMTTSDDVSTSSTAGSGMSSTPHCPTPAAAALPSNNTM